MTQTWPDNWLEPSGEAPSDLDISVAHPARV
jgi:hypothetical protein